MLGIRRGQTRADAGRRGQTRADAGEGFSPDGEKLTQNAGSGKRSAGLDLTFSADKSVSAVWAVAGERLRTAIADAHTAAVQYTLEHVTEAHCATTRIRTRGLNGARGELAIVPADLIAALFQHGTSREDDPQLHTPPTTQNGPGPRAGTDQTQKGMGRRSPHRTAAHDQDERLPLEAHRAGNGSPASDECTKGLETTQRIQAARRCDRRRAIR